MCYLMSTKSNITQIHQFNINFLLSFQMQQMQHLMRGAWKKGGQQQVLLRISYSHVSNSSRKCLNATCWHTIYRKRLLEEKVSAKMLSFLIKNISSQFNLMDSPSVIACIQSLDVRRECTQINSRHHEIERYTSSTDASAEAASSKSSLFGLCTQT